MALSEAGSAKGRRRRYREDDKENVSLVDENSQIRSADKRLKILYAIPAEEIYDKGMWCTQCILNSNKFAVVSKINGEASVDRGDLGDGLSCKPASRKSISASGKSTTAPGKNKTSAGKSKTVPEEIFREGIFYELTGKHKYLI